MFPRFPSPEMTFGHVSFDFNFQFFIFAIIISGSAIFPGAILSKDVHRPLPTIYYSFPSTNRVWGVEAFSPSLLLCTNWVGIGPRGFLSLLYTQLEASGVTGNET